MKRKLIAIASLLIVVCACAVVAQRIKKHGGLVDILSTGAISITPLSGQSATVTGPLVVTNAQTLTGTLTQNGVIKQTTTVSLTAAQIIAMGTTPVSLVAAPGSGKAIIVDNITFKMVRTATAFTSGGAVEFRYTDASGAKVTADVAAALITTGGAGTAFANVRGIEASITPVANAPIVITCATAPFATGTGTAVITIDYHVAI